MLVSGGIKVDMKPLTGAANPLWMTLYWIVGNTYSHIIYMMQDFKCKLFFDISGFLLTCQLAVFDFFGIRT